MRFYVSSAALAGSPRQPEPICVRSAQMSRVSNQQQSLARRRQVTPVRMTEDKAEIGERLVVPVVCRVTKALYNCGGNCLDCPLTTESCHNTCPTTEIFGSIFDELSPQINGAGV